MNFFSRLPSNIRRDIIVHVESYSSIRKLIGASPTMLWQYTIDRHSIARDILKPILALDTTGYILQDALIIVHSHDPSITLDPHHGLPRLLSRHCPDPVAQNDKDMTLKLYRLISLIICWIEDYMGKATDPFPSRAYMALPEIATDWTGTRYQGEIVDIQPVLFSQLSPSERSRFLRAFLRVEAICRFYVLRPQCVESPANLMVSRFRSRLLNLSRDDVEAALCASSYLMILYKFIFKAEAYTAVRRSARKTEWQPSPPFWALPDRPSSEPSTKTSSPGCGTLGFPEFVCLGTELTLHDPRFLPLSIPYESPIFGFSDLSSTLVSANRTGERPNSKGHLKVQRDRVKSLSSHLSSINSLPFPRRRLHSVDFQQMNCRYISICLGRLDDQPRGKPLLFTVYAEDLVTQTARQRAHGMFEDSRFYPDGKCNLPTPDDLKRLADDTWRSFGVREDEPRCRATRYPMYWTYLAGNQFSA